jgi:hypothetical protein
MSPGVRFGVRLTSRSVSARSCGHAVAVVPEFMDQHVDQQERLGRVVGKSNVDRSVTAQ